MSLWTDIKRLFGSADTVKTVIDGVYNGIDKTFFTDEEKAEFGQKRNEWLLQYMTATQPQNVARRVIAFIVVGTWAMVITILVVALVVETAFTLTSTMSDELYKLLKDIILQPFNIVLGFYFLTHVVKGIVQK